LYSTKALSGRYHPVHSTDTCVHPHIYSLVPIHLLPTVFVLHAIVALLL